MSKRLSRMVTHKRETLKKRPGQPLPSITLKGVTHHKSDQDSEQDGNQVVDQDDSSSSTSEVADKGMKSLQKVYPQPDQEKEQILRGLEQLNKNMMWV